MVAETDGNAMGHRIEATAATISESMDKVSFLMVDIGPFVLFSLLHTHNCLWLFPSPLCLSFESAYNNEQNI